MTIVDTPGTNAIFREHERLTTEFVPRADLVLFVTSADRPFTESERAFLEVIRNWGKKIVVVVNKIDLLERSEEREQVRAVRRRTRRSTLAPSRPSSPCRRVARCGRSLASRSASRCPHDRFDELEHYISSTLDERERLRLKLLNPARHRRCAWRRRLATTIDGRMALLRGRRRRPSTTSIGSSKSIGPISRESSSSGCRRSTTFSSSSRIAVCAFFDDTLRIGRLPDLMNKARIQREFERDVVADVPRQIESQVHDVIDWMVASALRQWQAVTEHVNRRRAAHEDRVTGGQTSGFQYDRAKLIATVGRAANQAVDRYDRDARSLRNGRRRARRCRRRRARAGRRRRPRRRRRRTRDDDSRRRDGHRGGGDDRGARDVRDPVEARARQDAAAQAHRPDADGLDGQPAQCSSAEKSSAARLPCATRWRPTRSLCGPSHEKLSTLSREIDEISGALVRLRIEVERAT